MAHVVTALAVVVRNEEGALSHVYRDAQVPGYVTGEQLDRLLDLGFVAEVEEEKPARSSRARKSDES